MTGDLPRGCRFPGLIVIGAQKCATTSLWHYLGAHPDISMAAGKETNFFLWHHERGASFYEGLIDPEAAVVGEVCPDYSVRPFSDGVAERIAAMVPDARLIYVVRDPVERVLSHWHHAAARGRDPLSFAASVASPAFPDSEYVLRSRYWWQLEPFLASFPTDRIRIVVHEDLEADAERVVGSLVAFAGLDPGDLPADALDRRLNRSAEKRLPPPLARALLLPGARATSKQHRAWRVRLLAKITERFGGPAPAVRPGPAERERIMGLLSDDVRALSEYVGRPLWGIAP